MLHLKWCVEGYNATKQLKWIQNKPMTWFIALRVGKKCGKKFFRKVFLNVRKEAEPSSSLHGCGLIRSPGLIWRRVALQFMIQTRTSCGCMYPAFTTIIQLSSVSCDFMLCWWIYSQRCVLFPQWCQVFVPALRSVCSGVFNVNHLFWSCRRRCRQTRWRMYRVAPGRSAAG